MKKQLSILAFAAAAAVSQAEGFEYLTFTRADGTEQSVAASGLTITFANGCLVATQGGAMTSIALADLNKMEFTATASGLSTLSADDLAQAPLNVYSPSGLLIGTYADTDALRSALPAGVYLVKQNGQTAKIVLK